MFCNIANYFLIWVILAKGVSAVYTSQLDTILWQQLETVLLPQMGFQEPKLGSAIFLWKPKKDFSLIVT